MRTQELSIYVDSRLFKESSTTYFLDQLVTLYKKNLIEWYKKYPNGWEPRDPEFDRLLLSKGITRKHPDLLTLVLQSITVRRVQTGYVLGISPTVYYPGSHIPLIDYVSMVEFGTSVTRARPLLMRVKRVLEPKLRMYYQYVIDGGELV